MTERKVRCGVIGVGSLGQHHARVYSALPGVELVGVCDADKDRAQEVADRHSVAVFDSPEALAVNCDAVSVVVPTPLHAETAIPVMEAGCHVLVEKPICASLEEAEKLLAVADRHDRIVQVGHIEHFNPVMSYLEEHVSQPLYITADRLAPFQPRGTDVGVVLDLMIHDLGIILALAKDRVIRVDAVGVQVLSGKEDIANARIEFAGGCVANINTSRVSRKKLREIRVFQNEGYLSLDFMNQAGHLVRKQTDGLLEEAIPLEKEEPLKLELASFVACVREQNDPKVSGSLGKTALELAVRITELVRERMARM